MLKILHARLQQYMNQVFPDVQAGFRISRGIRDQNAKICWIIKKKQENSRQTTTSASLTYAKAFDCGKFLKRWEYQTISLVSWEACMQVKKQLLEPDMEQWMVSKLGKEYCILSPCLFNLYAEYIHHAKSWAGWSRSWIEDCQESINNLRYADDTTFMAKSEEELKILLMKVKRRVKKLA